MVAKIVKGTSFGKALNYMIDPKKSAEIIASGAPKLRLVIVLYGLIMVKTIDSMQFLHWQPNGDSKKLESSFFINDIEPDC